MAAGADFDVVRGALVRVLAVGQVGRLHQVEHDPVGERLGLAEPLRDGRVVPGRVRERLGRKLAAGLGGQVAAAACAARPAGTRSAPGRSPPPPSRSSWPRHAPSPGRPRRCSRSPRARSLRGAGPRAGTGTGCRRPGRSARCPRARAMPCRSSWLRRARIAAWMCGCSVLTRPPSISAEPVSCSTEVTGSPASVRKLRGAGGGDQLDAELDAGRRRSPPGRSCR